MTSTVETPEPGDPFHFEPADIAPEAGFGRFVPVLLRSADGETGTGLLVPAEAAAPRAGEDAAARQQRLAALALATYKRQARVKEALRPEQVDRLAERYRQEADALAAETAALIFPHLVKVYCHVANATPRAEVLRQLHPVVRHFEAVTDATGRADVRFVREAFDVERATTHLVDKVRRAVLEPDSPKSLAEWTLTAALEGVLDDLEQGEAGRRALAGRDGAAYVRDLKTRADDPERGLRVRVADLRAELPAVLARSLLWSWDLRRRTLPELEALLGLRPAEDVAPPKAPLALVSPDPFALRSLAPFSSGAPAYGAAKALLQAQRWPLDEQGRPHFVHKVDGEKLRGLFHYQIVVPSDPSSGDVTVAHAELARSILKDMGRDTAWLHMLLLVYAAETRDGERATVPRTVVYRALGLDKRTDLPRREKDRRCSEEIGRLKSLGLSVVHLVLQGNDLARDLRYHRRTGSLWFLSIDDFGQGRFEDDTARILWQDWQLLVRPGEWAAQFLYSQPMRQLGYLNKEMFTHIDRRRAPWSIDLAVRLAFEGRFGAASRLGLRNRDIIEFAGGDPNPRDREGRRETRTRLMSAIEEQTAWGWRVDYSGWPAALRPDLDAARADRLALAGSDGSEATPRRMPRRYWDDFVNAMTTFVAPDELAALNAEAAHPGSESRKRLPQTQLARLPAPRDTPPAVTASGLRATRRRLGLSQAQLGQALGVSQALIARMEAGRRTITPAVSARLTALAPPEPEEGSALL